MTSALYVVAIALLVLSAFFYATSNTSRRQSSGSKQNGLDKYLSYRPNYPENVKMLRVYVHEKVEKRDSQSYRYGIRASRLEMSGRLQRSEVFEVSQADQAAIQEDSVIDLLFNNEGDCVGFVSVLEAHESVDAVDSINAANTWELLG